MIRRWTLCRLKKRGDEDARGAVDTGDAEDGREVGEKGALEAIETKWMLGA